MLLLLTGIYGILDLFIDYLRRLWVLWIFYFTLKLQCVELACGYWPTLGWCVFTDSLISIDHLVYLMPLFPLGLARTACQSRKHVSWPGCLDSSGQRGVWRDTPIRALCLPFVHEWVKRLLDLWGLNYERGCLNYVVCCGSVPCQVYLGRPGNS